MTVRSNRVPDRTTAVRATSPRSAQSAKDPTHRNGELKVRSEPVPARLAAHGLGMPVNSLEWQVFTTRGRHVGHLGDTDRPGEQSGTFNAIINRTAARPSQREVLKWRKTNTCAKERARTSAGASPAATASAAALIAEGDGASHPEGRKDSIGALEAIQRSTSTSARAPSSAGSTT